MSEYLINLGGNVVLYKLMLIALFVSCVLADCDYAITRRIRLVLLIFTIMFVVPSEETFNKLAEGFKNEETTK